MSRGEPLNQSAGQQGTMSASKANTRGSTAPAAQGSKSQQVMSPVEDGKRRNYNTRASSGTKRDT
jgi:hypothetical protein